jgi:hypothetical protein
MQSRFFSHQFIHRFLVHLIGHATVNRTNCSTLRLFMKALAFSTFIGNDIIRINTNRRMTFVSICSCTIEQRERAFYGCTICYRPLYPAFINGIIRAFGFAGSPKLLNRCRKSFSGGARTQQEGELNTTIFARQI